MTPQTWDAALRLLAGALPIDQPSVVALDEMPYLIANDSGFEGTLQALFDRELSRRPMLLICIGSDLAMMEALNEYGRPFHQRGREMVVPPLSPADVAEMLDLPPAEAFDAYLVSGGLPLILDEWPSGAAALDYLADAVSDPTSALLVSGERALAAEFPTASQARLVLGAIGAGERTFSSIARTAGGMPPASLSRALELLSDYTEPARLRTLPLCAGSPAQQALLAKPELGRLNVTTATGLRADGACYEDVYAFGGRSFSVWTTDGLRLYDSGADFERITAAAYPDSFNASNTNNYFDNRSDDKGPEPEGVTIGEIAGRTYAFVGLERIGGVMVYDITDPRRPVHVQYLNHRDFTAEPGTQAAGDLGPEGLHFIRAKDSPAGRPLLAVANEVSGTTTLFQIGRG